MIDLTRTLERTLAACDRAGADYFVVGSGAAGAWGVVRMTRDIDVVVVMAQADSAALVAGLAESGLYIPTGEASTALDEGGSFNVLHPISGAKVDVFVVPQSDEFTQSRMRRRCQAEVLGFTTWVASAEDVVLAKLRWRQTSRSETQWQDCVELAAANDLDVDYLRSWATPLGVTQDLEELLTTFA